LSPGTVTPLTSQHSDAVDRAAAIKRSQAELELNDPDWEAEEAVVI